MAQKKGFFGKNELPHKRFIRVHGQAKWDSLSDRMKQAISYPNSCHSTHAWQEYLHGKTDKKPVIGTPSERKRFAKEAGTYCGSGSEGWVKPHKRNGKFVKGHYRKRKSTK